MAERTRGKSRKRSHVAKKFLDLGKLDESLPSGWHIRSILIGFAVALVTTALLMEYEFQSIPDYKVGDIADRTIEAPENFTVVDETATEERRQQAQRSVPAVFSFDLRVNQRIAAEIRMSFADARDLIQQKRTELNLKPEQELPAQVQRVLKSELEDLLPGFAFGKILDICLKYRFSQELEDQLVGLIFEAMQYPGVVLNRDVLLRYRDRGIVLRNPITGRMDTVTDWRSLRDMGEAANLLRQQEYELTLVSAEEKKELISFLERWIVHNTDFDEAATRENERKVLADVDPVLNQVKRGKNIVRSGDEITLGNLSQLQALQKLRRQERWLDRFVGVFLLVGFFYGLLWASLQVDLIKSEERGKDFLLLASVMVIALVVTRGVAFLADLIAGSLRISELQNPVHFYFLAPVALGAVLTVLLVGVNLALFYSLAQAVFIGIFADDVGFFIYCLAGSLTAIYALRQYRERSALIRAGLVIGAVNLLTIIALQFASPTFYIGVFLVRCSAGILSGLLASMLTSLLLPLLESIFNLTTDIRLLELSNLNSPILRRLALEAPGTYHHSITVGTLAEAGAESIGANTLLIRVGAYYHDIGKLKHPEYYVENQIFTVNKHEGLSPTMSSLILASHVKDGLAIAREMKLGPKVADLIPQHHGTRVMTFFYRKAKEAGEGKGLEVSEDDFRYPGPKPQGKEAAILMLADQVEAASRTLQDPTPGQIRSLISRIVQATIQDGQLDECDINMMELTKVARAFERVLTGMYHHRIEYPGFDFNRQQVETSQPENQRVQ